jgi:hypothetical protein
MTRCPTRRVRASWGIGASIAPLVVCLPSLANAEPAATKAPAPAPAPAPVDEPAPASTKLEGIKGIAGLGLGYGPTLHSYRIGGDGDLDGPDTFMGFLFALEAGALLNRVELKLEWAPGTYQPLLKDEPAHVDAGKSFYTVIGSVGYYIPISDMVYWPMRIGAGVGSDRSDFVARLDLINVAVKIDKVLVGVSLPTIRYMSDFDDYHRWTGLFALNAHYVFP